MLKFTTWTLDIQSYDFDYKYFNTKSKNNSKFSFLWHSRPQMTDNFLRDMVPIVYEVQESTLFTTNKL